MGAKDSSCVWQHPSGVLAMRYGHIHLSIPRWFWMQKTIERGAKAAPWRVFLSLFIFTLRVRHFPCVYKSDRVGISLSASCPWFACWFSWRNELPNTTNRVTHVSFCYNHVPGWRIKDDMIFLREGWSKLFWQESREEQKARM